MFAWQALIAALGGDDSMSAIYDGIVNASASSGLEGIGDARGGGFGAAVLAGGTSTTAKPDYDATTGAITLDGVTTWMCSAPSALFDLSVATSLFVVMSGAGAADGRRFHGLCDSRSVKRALMLAATGTDYSVETGAAGIVSDTSEPVAYDATVRLIIVSATPGGDANIDIPSQSRGSGGGGTPSSGNNVLTFGGFFQNAHNASVLYAAGVIPRIVTASDLTALEAYAATKGYTPA